MDWDPKIPPPCWDIVSELDLTTPSPSSEPTPVPVPAPAPVPNNSTQSPPSPSPTPLDLKLNSGVTSPPPGPAKRQKMMSGGAGNVAMARCLVEGCKADLSKCREYHRRHKVCEVHSKTPMVVVAGKEQRFCQQCSRFHLLGEFDDAKRSCRKRLEGHNRRRRKPQSDHLSARGFLANHQGSRFGAFPPIFPSTRSEMSNWAMIKSEPVSISSPVYPPLQYASKPRRQFPFLHEPPSDIAFTSLPPPVDHSASDCALSLLSSPVISSPVVQSSSAANRLPMAQPLLAGFQYNNGVNERRVSAFAVSSLGGTGEVNNGFQGSFQLETGQEGTSQSLPFSWQ